MHERQIISALTKATFSLRIEMNVKHPAQPLNSSAVAAVVVIRK